MTHSQIEAGANSDRELWREPSGDYYADSIHVTKDGGIGINVGGTVIVKPLREWHSLALPPAPFLEAAKQELRASIDRMFALWNPATKTLLVEMAAEIFSRAPAPAEPALTNEQVDAKLDEILGFVPSDLRQHSMGVVDCVKRLRAEYDRLLQENHEFRHGHRTPPAERQRAEIAERERDEARLRLLSAAGDDLCRLSEQEIKELSSGGVKIPPKEEFLASCERFHQQIASGPGVLSNCLTLAQLIAENEQLRSQLAAQAGEGERAKPQVLSYPGTLPAGHLIIAQHKTIYDTMCFIAKSGVPLFESYVYVDYGVPQWPAQSLAAKGGQT